MLLTEHEGKALLRSVRVAVPPGVLARSATALARRRLAYPVAVKAQVAVGGRGKAGGIVRADSAAKARAAVAKLLTRQFAGERPSAVLVEPWLAIERELYLSVTVDAAAEGYVVLYSPHGGMEVEAGVPPVRYDVGPARSFRAHHLRAALAEVESDATVRERVIGIARRLVSLASSRDCTTVEINPLAKLADGTLIAADAKVVRDDYAQFRAADIAERIAADHAREPEAIARALAGNLMLVWLDGEVGLISGGAGMTMATMDLIAEAGGKPACFLDCSANPTPQGYRLAFDLLDGEPAVKAILVSIFGGLTQMDRVARSLKEIMASRKSRKPVVFRLNGTNIAQANESLAEARLHNHETLEGAVREAVALARKGSHR